jgi:predicted RND superfamily exporter protein
MMDLPIPSFPTLVARGTKWCLRHARATFGGMAVLIFLSTLAATRLSFDPTPEAYLKNTPEWETYARIDHTYGLGETVVIALREPGGTVFDAETISAVRELHRLVSAMPEVGHMLSIANAQDSAATTADLPPAPTTMTEVMSLATRITEHPMYRRLLVDEKHETTFLLAQLKPSTDPLMRMVAVRKIREQAQRFVSSWRSVHLAGSAVTKEAIAAGVQYDMAVFFPTVFVLLVVLLWIMFGSLVASLIPIAVVAFTSTLVVGLLGALGVPINMATATIPIVIVVVGLADSVYFLSEAQRQWSKNAERETALLATVRVIAMPCLLTSATSAVGFIALVSSRVAPLRQFGYGAAIGIVVAHACSLFLSPVLLAALKYPRESSDGKRSFVAAPRLGRALTRFAALAGRHLFVTVGLIGVLSGACVAAASKLEINSDFIGYIPPEHGLRRDMAVIEKTFGGADSLELVLDGGHAGAFNEPDVLAKEEGLEASLRKLDGIPGVFGLPDYLRFSHQNDDSRASLVSSDARESRIAVQIPTRPSEQVLAWKRAIEATSKHFLEGSGISATLTGLPLLFSVIMQYLVEDALRSFGFAALLIWLAMALGMRSLGLASVAMIPTVLPVIMTLASMVVLRLPYDPSSAFVACLAIGIAVDNTIHIVSRYQKAREQGSPTPVKALQYALTYAGHPVILASVLLVVGFSVVTLSSFVPTFRVGILSALLVVYTLMSDLLLLPVLLIAVDRLGDQFEPGELTRPSSVTGYFKEAASFLGVTPSEPAPPAGDDKPDQRSALL